MRMKIKPTKTQWTWGIVAFWTTVGVLLVYYLIFHFNSLASGISSLNSSMASIFFGVLFALILSPLVNWFEKKILIPKYKRKGIDIGEGNINGKYFRRMRKWSVFFTELVFILILALLVFLIVPSTVDSVFSIADNIQVYIRNLTRSVNELLESIKNSDFGERSGTDESTEFLQDFFNSAGSKISSYISSTLLPDMSDIIKKVSDSVVQVVRNLFNIFVGIIVSCYLLYSKEKMAGQFKKLGYALFREETANDIIAGFRFVKNTFVGFFSGKILDSIIIGVLCFIGTTIMRIPYAGLVSTVVGVTNIIPFFGPYIGGIFGALVLVLIDPLKALYFLIFIICLQQFDGNILGPKILGNSTGISSFWVIFSIMLFGAMFGFVGWIVGVPIFAVIYTWVKYFADHQLEKKNLPTDTAVYSESAYIRGGEVHFLQEKADSRYVPKMQQSPLRMLFGRGEGNRKPEKGSGEESFDDHDKKPEEKD